MSRDIRLELLLGAPVVARNGVRVGRLEEVISKGDQVSEFHVGEAALLERLSAIGLFHWKRKGYRVRWDQIDLSDVRRPRLTCSVEDLVPL